MRSILTTAFMAASLTMAVADDYSFDIRDEAFNATANTGGQPIPSYTGLSLKTFTDVGCYTAPGRDMVDMGVYTYQSTGWCQPLCWRQSYQYMALVNGSNCFCGNKLPDSKYKTTSDQCSGQSATDCTGSADAKCGGQNAFDVYNDGWFVGANTGTAKITVPKQTYTFSDYVTSTSSSSTTMQATVVVTQSATADPAAATTSAPPASSGGGKTAAIAAGIVVAVVVVLSIAGGIFFFMRRKKQKALAEEQRRHEMLTNFVTAEKPGSGYTSPDSRLDPSLMFSRRMSDGSIRDNEDYSRRILKVANPDD